MSHSDIYDQMFANAVHIGSHRTHWSPKMKDFIHSKQNNVHVFDLTKTVQHLEDMKHALQDFCKNGKELLIVGTKVQSQLLVRDLARETGHHSIASVWVPGLLTNWNTIKRRIKEYNSLVKDIETGKLQELSKKEKSMAMITFNRLKKRYEGIKDLKRLPDGILVLDGRYDHLAIEEAHRCGIQIFSFLGTTGDPQLCDFFIPANVNNLKSLTFLIHELQPVMKRVARVEKPRPGFKKPGTQKSEAGSSSEGAHPESTPSETSPTEEVAKKPVPKKKADTKEKASVGEATE